VRANAQAPIDLRTSPKNAASRCALLIMENNTALRFSCGGHGPSCVAPCMLSWTCNALAIAWPPSPALMARGRPFTRVTATSVRMGT
jgi:hypothetical protein